ncbi:galactokinase [Oceanivirga miroungae]|uniref:Galactokinase n=1 Tax=Oceanivirga miroungae TaxID=1130046 RepID=A0A6I8M604_9FUSO|nr:galactokinase family protein [Oceanivirga miroungae]VWL84842.1 galactokinase [Oceanivirga miroungae]
MRYLEQVKKLYKNNEGKIKRFEDLIKEFKKTYKDTEEYELFSSSGRTEIIGNHTDHNFGKVVCASIDLDTIAVATKEDSNLFKLKSLDFKEEYIIDINDLEKKESDSWSTLLIKGILKGVSNIGKIGGANIVVTSDVIPSSGVSSSASFEMLITTILNSFYNDSKLDIVSLAKAGQYSENFYWDKKSGLLDQIACSHGGMIAIDFKDIKNPTLEKLNSSKLEDLYDIVLVPTGGSHEDLGEEYSSIPSEMKSIASKELRYIDKKYIMDNFKELRKNLSDRAILRAFHFFNENEKVDELIPALKNENYDKFLEVVRESGLSSFRYLQNVYVAKKPEEQPIPIALNLTEMYIHDNKLNAATRVHGGGFAGVIMVVLEKKDSDNYINYIENYIDDKCYKVSIRPYGSVDISKI